MKIEEPFFIDTNILIYFFDEDSEFYQFSRDLISCNINNACLASKTIAEFVCVMSKKGFYNIIENELIKISSRFQIIYPNNLSLELFNDMVLKYKPKGNQSYDFEIVSVMLANGINKIATINKKDFLAIEEIEIISM